MIARFIRRWLGLNSLQDQLRHIEDELVNLRSDLAVTFFDESHPTRKAMSDKLGQRAIARLKGEDLARRHTLGER